MRVCVRTRAFYLHTAVSVTEQLNNIAQYIQFYYNLCALDNMGNCDKATTKSLQNYNTKSYNHRKHAKQSIRNCQVKKKEIKLVRHLHQILQDVMKTMNMQSNFWMTTVIIVSWVIQVKRFQNYYILRTHYYNTCYGNTTPQE